MPRTEPGRQTALADRPAYAPPKLIVLGTVAEVTLAPKPMGSGDGTTAFSGGISDRALKERVQGLDTGAVLRAVAGLDMSLA
jgi:hypothetical protein